ncbi:MAG: hypothetical protein E7357_01265 [Clostridiales bacterium]|nr:hypothetical protein [Clostridiales bacterium]
MMIQLTRAEDEKTILIETCNMRYLCQKLNDSDGRLQIETLISVEKMGDTPFKVKERFVELSQDLFDGAAWMFLPNGEGFYMLHCQDFVSAVDEGEYRKVYTKFGECFDLPISLKEIRERYEDGMTAFDLKIKGIKARWKFRKRGLRWLKKRGIDYNG